MDEDPEPEVNENGNNETRNEGENLNADEEKQEQEEKERMEREARNKSEAEDRERERERADREEFKKKMAEEEESKTVFIKGRQTDITAINAGRARKEIEEIIGHGFSIFKVRDSLKLVTRRLEQKEKMMAVKKLLGNDIIITEPYNITNVKKQAKNK